MKHRKQKPQFMLESIGEKPGKLLSVTESAINVISDGFDDPGNVVYDINIPDEYIGFKKLKYTSNVIMRFGIK
jgi:hypothetical protein